MPGEMPRFTIRIPQQTLEGLRALAEARNKTPSDLLRDLVTEELRREGYPLDPQKGGETA